MRRALRLLPCLLILSSLTLFAAPPAVVPDQLLFDFEDPATLKNWANLELPDAAVKEPPVRWEFVPEHASSGKNGLKLTFAGGQFPTLTTTEVFADWTPFQTLKAEVWASRDCVIGFTALQEKSERGGSWEAIVSRWTKTVFLKPGKNEILATIPQPNEYGISAKRGKVVRFEIFMYHPHPGETIFVDQIRLSSDKVAPTPETEFTLVGTAEKLSGKSSADAVIKLGKKLKEKWSPPVPQSIEQVEANFQQKFTKFKAEHPKAVLAILRDGAKGFDPARPDAVYTGWKDAYWNSHGPDTAFVDRAINRGHAESHEVFMRHRSPLMQVDLSSIPQSAKILAAELIITRANEKYLDDHNPDKKPTFWVVEPCNRPWNEFEVNAFEYARDLFWKEIGGMSWNADPDFHTAFLAHGPGQGKVNVWDFTEAVRYWTNGKNPNYGFMLHGDSHDYLTAATREAKELQKRPTVLVIYEAAPL
ncbi:MAG: hypothetical protein JWM11_1727 [Planctomycetaceae bacterium]|nr:hypothetical protein [Planctomycetaceae bacterium]